MHAASAEGATRASPEPLVDAVRVEAVAAEGESLHLLALLEEAEANGALGGVARPLGVGGDGEGADGGGVEPCRRVRRRVGGGDVVAAAGAEVEEVDEEEGDEEDEEEEEGAEEGVFGVGFVFEVGEMDRLEILGSHAFDSSVVFCGEIYKNLNGCKFRC